MANRLWSSAKEAILSGSLDLYSGAIEVVLFDADSYSFDDGDEFLDDVGSALIGSGVALSGRSVSQGVFSALSPVIFEGIAGGLPDVGGAMIYENTGSPSTSRLVAHIDVGYGLRLTRNGSDIEFRVDPGFRHLFKMSGQTLYERAAEEMLRGGIDLTDGSVKAMLIKSTGYTPDLESDEFMSSVPAGSRLTTGVVVTSPSVAAGEFTCADVTWTSVPDGDLAGYVVFYKSVGSDATDRLIAYSRSPSFPRPTNGNDFVFSPGTVFAV